VAADSLARARPVFDAFQAAGSLPGQREGSGRLSVFIYARQLTGIDRLRARMFAPLSGTMEDPATGSASAALGAYLVSLNPRADGDFAITIEQGVEMGRPSEIHLAVRKSQGKVESVKISGRCVTVMRGVLQIS
jgi:trans-2,3-dihydro-3-hydroxyanthranilate isomerase